MHRLKPQPSDHPRLADDLAEIARIGGLFLDGDALNEVYASGRDWTDADDINFDPAHFIEVKRTILRIERIKDFRYFVAALLIRRDDPRKVEAVVCGLANVLGRAPVPMTPAMRRCVRRGEVTTERIAKTGDVRAYAPVRTSKGEVVGLLMVSTLLGGARV